MTKSIKISNKAHKEIALKSIKQDKTMEKIVDDLVFIKTIKSTVVQEPIKKEKQDLKQNPVFPQTQLNQGGK